MGSRTTAIGREVRNGLNFVERGFGVRAALGCSDRATPPRRRCSRATSTGTDLRRDGARWFHCGGIFAALSPGRRRARARGDDGRAPARHGRLVRPQLPAVALEGERRHRGGGGDEPDARRAGRRAARQRGGLLGRARLLARRRRRVAHRTSTSPPTSASTATCSPATRTWRSSRPRCARRTPRRSTTGAASAARRDGFVLGPQMRGLEIFDRVGGGDSFASGLIYGLLSGADVDTALAYGVAHGALAMTTPGDTSMATLRRGRARHARRRRPGRPLEARKRRGIRRERCGATAPPRSVTVGQASQRLTSSAACGFDL